MLSKADAQILTEQAQQHARELGTLLMRLHDGQAWRALDYQSWTAYCADKFDESLRTIQRYIRVERIRELVGHANLARFTNEAIETLATVSPDQIRALADIAARTTTGRIGADVVRSVQAAVAETLVTGAVEGEGGQQYRVSDVMVAGVQEYQRENVLSKREYIMANVEVEYELEHMGSWDMEHDVSIPAIVIDLWELPGIPAQLAAYEGRRVHISIWRELE